MLHYIHVYTRNHARRTIYRYLSTTKDSTLIVSDEDWSKWSERGLQSFTIPLQHNKRHKDERAVLTVIQKEGNENALLWLPGRNDTFYHLHILDTILDRGFDVWAMDMRRSGRAKFAASGVQIVEDTEAHDSHDFREYFEELDLVYSVITNPAPRDPNIIINGGAGKKYKNIVLYGHSTGALQGVFYATTPQRSQYFSGFIFNSPFWRWPLPAYYRLALKYPHWVPLTWKFKEGNRYPVYDPFTKLDPGGNPNTYTIAVSNYYKWPPGTRCLRELSVSAGWASAVSRLHTELEQGTYRLNHPTICLYSEGDEVLDFEEIDKLSDFLHKDRKDGKSLAIHERALVERKIASNEVQKSSHDVLASPSLDRVNEAMKHLTDWLQAHFPKRSS